MHFSTLFTTFLVTSLTTAIPSNDALSVQIINLSTTSRPTVEEAAVQARKLLRSETISTLSTVFSAGEKHGLEGQPIGLMEYYADCSENGNPTLLGMHIATSYRNTLPENSTISLSVRQHAPYMFSPAAHPRLALIGKLKTIDDSDEAARLKRCFTTRHQDAKLWTPGNKIHETYWVEFEVQSVYWIGGFGNVAYIGWIPKELYQNAKLPCAEEWNGWRKFLFWGQGL